MVSRKLKSSDGKYFTKSVRKLRAVGDFLIELAIHISLQYYAYYSSHILTQEDRLRTPVLGLNLPSSIYSLLLSELS
jgi:hypothetical protein